MLQSKLIWILGRDVDLPLASVMWLEQMKAGGHTVKEIAAVLGTSHSRVTSWRLGGRAQMRGYDHLSGQRLG